MKVMKFGGTSVGSAERIKEVASLITGRGQNIVVLSAMSGTTNTLVEISDYLRKRNVNGAKQILNSLEKKYSTTISLLFREVEYRMEADEEIKAIFSHIRSLCHDNFSEIDEKEILAQGEMMSTTLMYLYLHENGVDAAFIPALDYMRIDADGEADTEYIREKLRCLLDESPAAQLYITQGYICRNHLGEVDNLRRGGSDLTATLVGAAIEAREIEIWTDIDGMHNNDPRYVEGTKPVSELHFDEAAELAYFGAKILHPACVLPAKVGNIPVRLLNTMAPELPGTLIYNTDRAGCIKAVAAKDDIIAIRIKSSRMLLASNFMHRVFEIFDNYRKPIDMIATSEVGVSVTVDSPLKLEHIVDELKEIGTVTVDTDMVIVCVVGDLEWHNIGFEAMALKALEGIPVRMISYGGSNRNISFLIRKEDKVAALNALSKTLFPA
ncbi:MAG: aspartate kinase [[Clostridium] fimetarium]|nr:aspartate kinase [Alistipes timonensis]MCM1404990.1 aspartate kinase [[Clostridium] fimetarium]